MTQYAALPYLKKSFWQKPHVNTRNQSNIPSRIGAENLNVHFDNNAICERLDAAQSTRFNGFKRARIEGIFRNEIYRPNLSYMYTKGTYSPRDRGLTIVREYKRPLKQ